MADPSALVYMASTATVTPVRKSPAARGTNAALALCSKLLGIMKPREWIVRCENEIHFFPPSISVDSIHLRGEPSNAQVVNRNIESCAVAQFAQLPNLINACWLSLSRISFWSFKLPNAMLVQGFNTLISHSRSLVTPNNKPQDYKSHSPSSSPVCARLTKELRSDPIMYGVCE